VDRLAGITCTRVSPERTRNLQRRSVDVHICHKRRATFPLAVAAVAEVYVVGRRRQKVADRSAKASAFESGFHGRHLRLAAKRDEALHAAPAPDSPSRAAALLDGKVRPRFRRAL
jgi:hypothetical protein